MIDSVIEIPSSRSHVFSVLEDFASYPKWLPGCSDCRVVSSADQVTEADITLRSFRTLRMRLRFQAQRHHALNFRMIRGQDLRSYSGSWRLMDSADGKGTIVRGEMTIDAGGFMPRFMTDRLARRAIEETAQSLRKRVRQTPVALEEAREEATPTRERTIVKISAEEDGYRVELLGESFHLKR